MKQSGETHRVSWKNMDLVKTFLQTCVQEVSLNGRHGNSLKPDSWNKVKVVLEGTHNFRPTQKQMKNHYDYLKDKYQAWLPITQKTDNAYDLATNTIHMTDAEWEEYLKTHPKAKPLRTSPLPFPDLCKALFDSAAATGVHGQRPRSTNSRPGASSTFSYSPDIELPGIEDIPVNNQSGGVPNSSPPTSQSHASNSTFEGERPAKKRKSLFKNSKLDEEISTALKLIIQKNNGPSVEECIQKLDGLGWDKGSSLYLAALGIFCESASHRELWMKLSEVETLAGWVKIMGTKLRLIV